MMQEILLQNKLPHSASWHNSANSPTSRLKNILQLLCLLGCLVHSLAGAFEGADLFRTLNDMGNGIYPAAMNNPARLPDQPIWLSIGYGKPMGLDWAACNTASIGGEWESMRGAAGIWISGDELYSERITSVALAYIFQPHLTAGLAISYQEIDIQDFSSIRGPLLIDGALSAALATSVDVSVWYSGQTLSREDSYTNPARQLFQVAVTRQIGSSISGSIAFEKTPPFSLRQRAEITITSRQNLILCLGYRTVPEIPCLGIQIPVGRLSVSFRLTAHPTLGLSTAFGLVYK